MSEFDTDTAVARAGDDLFRAQISDRWNTYAGPNGGYVLAIVARALSEQLPMPHPLTITGHFLRPPGVGSAEIRTEVVRVGKRHATARAHLSQEGKDIIVALATFADLAAMKGRELVLNESPGTTPPAIDPMQEFDAAAMPPIGHRMELRVAELPGFMRGEPSGRPAAELWMRFADGRPPDPLALVYLADAAVPTVFEIGEFVSSTVEMTVHVRGIPAEGWLAMRTSARHIIGGYHEEDMEIWDSEGKLVAQSRQLALLGG